MADSGSDEKAQMQEAEKSSLASRFSTAKSLFQRGHDVLVTKSSDTFSHGRNIVDNLTSYLGADNPFAHKADNPEQLVWLFDSAAYRATVSQELDNSPSEHSNKASLQSIAEATGASRPPDREEDKNGTNESATSTATQPETSATVQEGVGKEIWCTNLVAAFFVRRSGRDIAEFVSEVCKQLGIAEDSEESQRITHRVTPIFNTILPAHTADVRVGTDTSDEKSVMTLSPSDRSGISSSKLVPLSSEHAPGATVPVTVQGHATSMNATIRFTTPDGWAVISDIDDTIKKTLTDEARGILRTTFLDETEHIAGMPELYAQITEKFATKEAISGQDPSTAKTCPPPFWYLSASPYNLYPFLRQGFIEKHNFPPGSMYLKEASWMNITGFLASLTQDTRAYKVTRMDSIHASFPRRKFICFGDSTQSDPEAYADIYAKYPGWIKGIFIRRVAGVKEIGDGILPGQNNEERIKDSRFEEAFKDVPKDVWTVFDKPEEVSARLDEILAKHGDAA